MKRLLLFLSLFAAQTVFSQSLDYISVRKKNGRVIKNFYAGSPILLQLVDGSYLKVPIQAVRNDSLFVTLYDIRRFPTVFGSYVTDTIAVTILGLHHKEIKRIHLNKKKTFAERSLGPLLMLGGGGYVALNLLNGTIFRLPITDKKNLRTLGIAGGAFGLGYLFTKLFASDGFSKNKHEIRYIDL